MTDVPSGLSPAQHQQLEAAMHALMGELMQVFDDPADAARTFHALTSRLAASGGVPVHLSQDGGLTPEQVTAIEHALTRFVESLPKSG